MLHGLEQLDWRSLEHVYGEASDVPAHLRALQSPSEEEREDALEQLFCSIWHQGTVYSASAPAATFLVVLVANPATPDRVGILSLLQALATGSGYIEAHEPIMEADELAALCEGQNTTIDPLQQWRSKFGVYLAEHRARYQAMFDAYDAWWSLPPYEREHVPKPPRPPLVSYTDQPGNAWIITDAFLLMLDDLRGRLEKWLSEN